MQIILPFQIESENSGSTFQSRGVYIRTVNGQARGVVTTQPEVYTYVQPENSILLGATWTVGDSGCQSITHLNHIRPGLFWYDKLGQFSRVRTVLVLALNTAA